MSEVLDAFMRTADEELSRGSAFEGLMRLRRPFAEFAMSHALGEIVHGQLLETLTNPSYTLPALTERSEVIAKTDHFTMHLMVLPPVSAADAAKVRVLSSNTASQMIVCTAGGPIRLATFEESECEDVEVFSASRTLRARGELLLTRGAPHCFAAGHDVFNVSESAGAAVVRLEPAPESRLRWDYDGATLRPVRVVSASLQDSRLDFATRILARLGDAESAAHLARLVTEHPAHFVRWSALQALARLDRERAVRHLYDALADGHPHVRAAARATLVASGLEVA